MELPEIEVDLKSKVGIWSDATAEHVQAGQKLLETFQREAEQVVPLPGVLRKPALGIVKTMAYWLNSVAGRHFRAEMEDLSRVLKTSPRDILLANLAYDLTNCVGCSTFIQKLEDGGTLHARNLDWPFADDSLKRYLTVAHITGKQGPYSVVTWPGLFGVLTGVAEDRFAITVNYVLHRTESNWWSMVRRAVRGYWPVTWLVRKVFDEEEDYCSARERLLHTPLLAPVLFAISGPEGEGAVIEREVVGGEIRRLSEGYVCVTNHYASRCLKRSDALGSIDHSERRLKFLQEYVSNHSIRNADEAFDLLRSPEILNKKETQYQMAMSARDGSLKVCVP